MMMGQIIIRDLDDSIIAAYRKAAERNALSLEEEMRGALSQMRPRSDSEIEAMRDRISAIRAMTPNVPQTPAEQLVREDRDGYRYWPA